MKTARILVTGFGPFGGVDHNPSGDLAEALDGRSIGGAKVTGIVLPCEFGRSLEVLKKELRRVRPDAVVALGVAAGRDAITPERVAVNLDDARQADNAGYRPVERPVVARGPAAYWSGLPVKAIVRELERAGLPARLSMTAGTYVCNHVFYGLMHAVRRRPGVRAGFIHLPGYPDPSGRLPGWSSADLERGVCLALRVVARRRTDLRVGLGESS